ncbi:MAG TPA: hypothetical protein DCK93_14155 [Blastocatellia bacterium]|nr:hypothetical protein [Blastocatellia bacterium]HAF24025.1 hypothetical protein [Blastocatellia bacterium]
MKIKKLERSESSYTHHNGGLVVRKIFSLLVILLSVMMAAALSTQAQSALGQPNIAALQPAATNSGATATNPAANQAVVSSLANLPEVDTLIYINPQRILNEVVPRLMPAKDVEGMRKAFADVKTNAGIDPTKIDYIVIAFRFRKPTADLNFQPPEFMVVSSGDFSAESLMALARMASQGKLRDEKYGAKTLGLMTIDPLVKEAEKNPFLKAFTEVGIVTLNANTIAAGSPAYLRAAIDAGEGKERISTETSNSLLRDPNALISIAGTPWHSFAKSFGMLGTETTTRASRCESKIGNIYAALTMDATNFMLRGAMNADNPDTAKIMSNLYSGLLGYATSSIPDASAQALLKGIAVKAQGDEVTLAADFPQRMVADLIKKQMTPKPMEATEIKAPMKPAVRRRTHRRAVRH